MLCRLGSPSRSQDIEGESWQQSIQVIQRSTCASPSQPGSNAPNVRYLLYTLQTYIEHVMPEVDLEDDPAARLVIARRWPGAGA